MPLARRSVSAQVRRRSPWMAEGAWGTVSATASHTSAKFQSVTGGSLRCFAVDLALPGDDHPARAEFRAWLAANPDPTPRQLAAAGYVAPHWPRPWGLDADPIAQLVIDDEMRRAGVRRPFNQIGIGWAGPTLVHAGTEAQKERYLLPLLAGEEIWCQLFSEPGAGSDLAGLSTRAVRDGDEWVVTGQKVWTSFAHIATLGILLARTDPDVAKHQGISYFVCPMDAPGRDRPPHRRHDRRPRLQRGVPRRGPAAGGQPRGRGERRVGPGQGDPRQRAGVAVGGGRAVGTGPHRRRPPRHRATRRRASHDAVLRQRLARLWIEGEVLRLIRLRTVSAALAGRAPGPEASVRKALADDHGQRVMELAQAIAGTSGLLADAGPAQGLAPQQGAAPQRARPRQGTETDGAWPASVWAKGYLFSRALTIGGGTAEVQRNIIAERVLGLPHDVDVESGRSWADTHRALQA